MDAISESKIYFEKITVSNGEIIISKYNDHYILKINYAHHTFRIMMSFDEFKEFLMMAMTI